MALALLWKERGIPSQEALYQFLKAGPFAKRKGRQGIGHAGTLDPFAEGWLLVGVDEGTKLLSFFQGLDKEYIAEMILGATSISLDTDEVLEKAPEGLLENFLARADWEDQLRRHLASSLGEFQQVPPQFSAIRVGGAKRAYDFARAGKTVELKARAARLLEAEHLGASVSGETGLLHWKIRLRVSSGTYIRALARDWAQTLIGFPGLLCGLLRTRISTLGANHPHAGHQYLKLEDLRDFFEVIEVSENEIQSLRKGGLWHPRPSKMPQVLVSRHSGEALAFTEVGSGKLVRVFLSDPFSVPPVLESQG